VNDPQNFQTLKGRHKCFIDNHLGLLLDEIAAGAAGEARRASAFLTGLDRLDLA
jgi:hypothetical protein